MYVLYVARREGILPVSNFKRVSVICHVFSIGFIDVRYMDIKSAKGKHFLVQVAQELTLFFGKPIVPFSRLGCHFLDNFASLVRFAVYTT